MKKLGIYAATAAFATFSIFGIFIPNNAGATGGTKFSQCSNNLLDNVLTNNQNWADVIKATDSLFDVVNDPWLLFQTPTDVSAISTGADTGKPQNGFTMYRVPQGKSLTLINNTSTSDKLTYDSTSVTVYHFYWRPTSSTYVATPEYGTYPTATSSSTNPITLTSGSNVSCISTAHLVGYAPGYGYDYNNTVVKLGVAATPCPTDFLGAAACAISNAFKNVANDIKSVFMAALNTIGSFFTPDTAYIQTELSELNTFLTGKLGVLYWPFTVIPEILNSFSDTSDSWCNSSSCAFSTSGFYGHNISINFLAIKEISPTLWTMTTTIIKALVVLELIFLLRNKFMSVVQK